MVIPTLPRRNSVTELMLLCKRINIDSLMHLCKQVVKFHVRYLSGCSSISESDALTKSISATALSIFALTFRGAAAATQGSCWWKAEAATDAFPILMFASASRALASAAWRQKLA